MVEVEGRKYTIRVDGSNRVITRNRRFLKIAHQSNNTDILLPVIHDNDPVITTDNSDPNAQSTSKSDTNTSSVNKSDTTSLRSADKSDTTSLSSTDKSDKVPLMLRRLKSFNNPGLKE